MKTKIKVVYLGLLREIARKREEVVVIEAGSTIRELVAILSEKYGDRFKFNILSATGDVRPDVALAYNLTVLNDANILDQKVKDVGDSLQILVAAPAFAGG